MQIADNEKVQVLLRLMEQNAKSIEWLKGLDFKITYQTLFLYAAIVAFVSTKISIAYSLVRCILFVTVLLIAFSASIFLIRNHGRHLSLIREDANIRRALRLHDKEEYGESISEPKEPDFFFHLGRSLYVLFIIGGAALVGSLVWLIKP